MTLKEAPPGMYRITWWTLDEKGMDLLETLAIVYTLGEVKEICDLNKGKIDNVYDELGNEVKF